MIDVWFIQNWKNAVDTAMLNANKDGLPIVFIDSTTKLINAEADYKRHHKKESNKISGASGDYHGKASDDSGAVLHLGTLSVLNAGILPLENLHLVPSIMLIFQFCIKMSIV